MIAPLRRRHRYMALGLAIVVPPLVLWALLARQPPQVMTSFPPSLAVSEVALPGVPDEGSALRFSTAPSIATPVLAEVSSVRDGRRQLTVHATAPLAAPDPLLYWGAASALDGSPEPLPERLPDGVRLLGPWDGRPARFDLPNDAGTVWLYALGHQRVVGVLALPAAGGVQ